MWKFDRHKVHVQKQFDKEIFPEWKEIIEMDPYKMLQIHNP